VPGLIIDPQVFVAGRFMRQCARVGLTVGILLLLSASSSADRLTDDSLKGIDQRVNTTGPTDRLSARISWVAFRPLRRSSWSIGRRSRGFSEGSPQHRPMRIGAHHRGVVDRPDRSGRRHRFGGFLGVGSRKIGRRVECFAFCSSWPGARFHYRGITRDQVRSRARVQGREAGRDDPGALVTTVVTLKD